ncbi:protein translocase subunit SecD [Amnibacterium kyonggiense]|uniref:Protein translocase subunit SecD n=1 Tax=Amnibacterium kyonggiense TaxID=595671 RepID=A0A4V3EAQ6_9MICO|nr:protein translocase subunit SecD [Amnibacterium kyonggiense]TDS77484.1 preprotein translocase subunit SecD [Amnibacterium kyonggiense]
MPSTVTPKRHARRALTGLVVIILLGLGLNSIGVFTSTASTFAGKAESLLPKLGLDLAGGTQIILAATTENGGNPTADQLSQSVAIIRQRAAAGGSPDAQISTQGGRFINVSLPGTPSQATINSVREAARMDFRPVLLTDAAATASAGTGDKPYTPPASLGNTPSAKPTNGSDLSQVTPYLQNEFDNYRCAAENKPAQVKASVPLVTCDNTNTQKFLLGPVEVPGTGISGATAGLQTTSQGATTGTWVVNLTFNSTGTQQFAKISERLVGLQPPQNQFAILLDGKVISAPTMNAAITNGKAEISGSFTEDSSKELASQLKFGALPVNFTVQSQNTISATLGSSQLLAGLIAGLIGLILVFVYAVFQYRLLASVVLASLGIGAVLTFIVLDFLSWREGYRLSLAGVTGIIVSIGITADSFIVYFERIRDELREGRSLEGAVETGWRRARRTVLASDAVNLLAAGVLFVLAVGDVQGFALTLGLSTLIDVLVVVLFTHPMLQLLARRPFFAEGHAFSGLDPRALGAVYRGRGQFRAPLAAGGREGRSVGEAQRRQTIAERKAADLGADTKGRS